MTPDARQHLLDLLANGAPDCALAYLLGRAQQAGLSAVPADIDVRGVPPKEARRVLRAALKRTREQLGRDAAALFA